MRPVPGLDRPVVQWMFVALALVLVVLTGALALAVRRLNVTTGRLHTLRMEDATARDQLEARLAREQSTREALWLELGRLRAGGTNGSGAASRVPTMTLQPLRRRESMPPPPTMSAPSPSQLIELRLMLPAGVDTKLAPFSFSVRDWTSGQERLTRAGLTAVAIEGGRAVAAFVSGDIFPPGAYEVILRSKEGEAASYEITIK